MGTNIKRKRDIQLDKLEEKKRQIEKETIRQRGKLGETLRERNTVNLDKLEKKKKRNRRQTIG